MLKRKATTPGDTDKDKVAAAKRQLALGDFLLIVASTRPIPKQKQDVAEDNDDAVAEDNDDANTHNTKKPWGNNTGNGKKPGNNLNGNGKKPWGNPAGNGNG